MGKYLIAVENRGLLDSPFSFKATAQNRTHTHTHKLAGGNWQRLERFGKFFALKNSLLFFL